MSESTTDPAYHGMEERYNPGNDQRTISEGDSISDMLEKLDSATLTALAYNINESTYINTNSDIRHEIAAKYRFEKGRLVPSDPINVAQRIESNKWLLENGRPVVWFPDNCPSASTRTRRPRGSRKKEKYVRKTCRQGWQREHEDDVRCKKICREGWQRPSPGKPCKKPRAPCRQGLQWKSSTRRCVKGPKIYEAVANENLDDMYRSPSPSPSRRSTASPRDIAAVLTPGDRSGRSTGTPTGIVAAFSPPSTHTRSNASGYMSSGSSGKFISPVSSHSSSLQISSTSSASPPARRTTAPITQRTTYTRKSKDAQSELIRGLIATRQIGGQN